MQRGISQFWVLVAILAVALVAGITFSLTKRNSQPQTSSPNPAPSASPLSNPTPVPSPTPIPSASPTNVPVRPSPTPIPIPRSTPASVVSPIPSPQQTPAPTGVTREVKVWMLAYYPNTTYVTEIGDPAAYTKNTLLPALNEASRYHGYSNANAQASLRYTLSSEDIKTENNPPPTISGKYDYGALFSKYDLCNVAKQKDIKAVILWADGLGEYAGGMWESAITGSGGIPTNGAQLPYCPDKTIVVYGLNYTRGLAEALESYSHHLEAVFRRFRPEWSSWSGENESQNQRSWGRGTSCGNAHNPPNASAEYDRINTAYFQSDCRNWKPDRSGQKENLNCTAWKCTTDGYLQWWMQNMPGAGNTLMGTDGKKVPNWWVYIADPDRCVSDSLACS